MKIARSIRSSMRWGAVCGLLLLVSCGKIKKMGCNPLDGTASGLSFIDPELQIMVDGKEIDTSSTTIMDHIYFDSGEPGDRVRKAVVGDMVNNDWFYGSCVIEYYGE